MDCCFSLESVVPVGSVHRSVYMRAQSAGVQHAELLAVLDRRQRRRHDPGHHDRNVCSVDAGFPVRFPTPLHWNTVSVL